MCACESHFAFCLRFGEVLPFYCFKVSTIARRPKSKVSQKHLNFIVKKDSYTNTQQNENKKYSIYQLKWVSWLCSVSFSQKNRKSSNWKCIGKISAAKAVLFNERCKCQVNIRRSILRIKFEIACDFELKTPACVMYRLRC